MVKPHVTGVWVAVGAVSRKVTGVRIVAGLAAGAVPGGMPWIWLTCGAGERP